MAGGFIQRSRHGTVFYFRRRVPSDLRDRVGRAHIYVSLRTEELAHARRLARQLAVATDRLFLELRYMTDTSTDGLRLDYGMTFEFDSRGSPKITFTDAKPGDEPAMEDAARRILGLAKPCAALAPTSPTPTVAEAIQAVLASPDIKDSTKKEYRRAFEFFRGFVGADTRLGEIREERFSDFADHVRSHEHWSGKTQGFYITSAQRLFTYYQSRNSAVPKISAAGLKPKRAAPEGLDRAEYSLEELEIVFRRALRYRVSEPAKWWATVASAFLGTRIEELSQAHLDGDFRQDPVSGIYYLEVDQVVRGSATLPKSVKTKAGWRKVPIHPTLVDAGFIRYLEAERKAGRSTPFQSCWEPLRASDGRVKHSHYISRWGGAEIKALRKQAGLSQKLVYFHSMRHTFNTLLAKADVGDEWRSAICGHQYGGVNPKIYNKAKHDVAVTSPKLIEGLAPLVAMFERVTKNREFEGDAGAW